MAATPGGVRRPREILQQRLPPVERPSVREFPDHPRARPDAAPEVVVGFLAFVREARIDSADRAEAVPGGPAGLVPPACPRAWPSVLTTP